MHNGLLVKTSDEGYSLTEILLAILIFATTAAPLIQLFIQSSREAESAVDFYKASNYLSLEIEKMRSLYSVSPKTLYSSFPESTSIDENYEKYHISIKLNPRNKIKTVSAYDGYNVEAAVFEIHAEAGWKTNAGLFRTLVFDTSL